MQSYICTKRTSLRNGTERPRLWETKGKRHTFCIWTFQAFLQIKWRQCRLPGLFPWSSVLWWAVPKTGTQESPWLSLRADLIISLCLHVFIFPAKIIIIYVVVWMESPCQENLAFSFSPRLMGTNWAQWQRRVALLSGSMIAPPSFQPLRWRAGRGEDRVGSASPG